MPPSLGKILIHAVFSTKERRPFLRDKDRREELHRYLGGILANHDGQPIALAFVEHPEKNLFSELPGAAPSRAPRLLAGAKPWSNGPA